MWTIVSIGIAWALVCVNFLFLWRLNGKTRDHEEAEDIAWSAYATLTDLAVQSFMCNHRGTFKAWADTMGDIQVQVRTRPKDVVLGEED